MTDSEMQSLHQETVQCAERYRAEEHLLIGLLLKIDTHQVFRRLGYSSLFVYATGALKLAESQAYSLITIARKSREVPELKTAIENNELNIANARRICAVLTPENKELWLSKASSLPQRELEKEIVKVRPEKAVVERLKPVQQDREELRCGVSKEISVKIKRAQDLVSRKLGKGATLEETLSMALDAFLQKHDPVEKAKRQLPKAKPSPKPQLVARRALPAFVKHQVALRDSGRCTFQTPKGERCSETRFVEIHHKIPVQYGGENTAENLTTLCFHHHRGLHDIQT